MKNRLLILIIGIMILSGCSSGNQRIDINENLKTEVVHEIENQEEIIEPTEEVVEPELLIENKTEIQFEGLTIANWNLQIFGQSKASNQTLLEFYADTIDEYDIVFIQEIRDSSQTAFPKLCEGLEEYNCEVSSRAGRSSSKEQVGIIFKKEIELIEIKDYNPDSLDRWERPPVKVTFKIENYSLSIYNIHAKPDDVQNEMEHLQDIIVNEGNVIILGDLNADCSYYSNQKEVEFDSWSWLIKDYEDTTVSATDCAYDRIILNADANEEFTNYGIYKEGISKKISDHYLVWVSLGVDDFKPNITQINSEVIIDNTTIVKMSSTGICHDESSSYYERTIKYTVYDTIDNCLDAGGRMPK